MTTMTDSEIKTQGFHALVNAFGDVNAERFITLILREPFDYTKWRETHLYLDGDVHSLAERARAAGRRLREKDARNRDKAEASSSPPLVVAENGEGYDIPPAP